MRVSRLLTGTLALLVALAMPVAGARGAVISFDDLPAPPAPDHRVIVNVQYGAQGVTFNDIDSYNYSSGLYASPGFPHSGAVAAESPCFTVEICTSPIRADFTTGQDSVRVWVGLSFPIMEAVTVQLKAFDGASSPLGTESVVLNPTGSDIPVATPILIDPPGATIRKVEVTTQSGYTGGLAIDDIEFTTVGPPPPCGASGPPSVTVFQPSNGLTVQNDSFRMSGAVATNGAPITNATVERLLPAPHTSSVYPSLIDADGGSFGPVNFNGFLAAGANNFVISATNCAGTGTSQPRQVTRTPIPAGTAFHQLGRIEVSQTVQLTDNPVRLVAASADGVKRTFARVYLGLDAGPSSTLPLTVSSVTGRLTAVRPDGSRPGGPLSIPSLNTINVRSDATLQSARSSLANSLNFELPPEWLGPGPLHLELDRLLVEGAQLPMECVECDNATVSPALVRFRTVPPFRIWILRVPFMPRGGGAAVEPSQTQIDMIDSWLERAYPTAAVLDTQYWMPVQPGPPGFVDDDGDATDTSRSGFLCNTLNSRIKQWVGSMQAQNPNTRYYGVVSDAGGEFMRGCADIGGRYASGPTGGDSFGWDNDGSYGDWYAGHEIGHTFGRLHPGVCGESDDDDDFPYVAGRISNPGEDAQGIDAGDAAFTPQIPFQLYDWRDGWSDVMTYCNQQWLSRYTYHGILRSLCNGEPANCPDNAGLSSAASGRARGGSNESRSPRRKGRGPRLSVSGSLALPSGRLSLTQLTVLPKLALTQRPRRSPYSIVLRDGRRVLARYPFEPKQVSDLPVGDSEASVDEVVPFKAGADRILIMKGQRKLRSVAVSAHAPTVKLTKPKRGSKLPERPRIRWRSQDRDGGRQTYSLLYSHDGRNYVPIAGGLRKRTYRVDLSQLPGGRKARFRVVASDGVLASIATSGRFKVPVKSPRVSIATPASGAEVVEGQPLQLVADVNDLQDVSLPAESIIWSSSVLGELGRGATISTPLNPGVHELTVTATNGGGASSSASVTVTVSAVPPDFNASP